MKRRIWALFVISLLIIAGTYLHLSMTWKHHYTLSKASRLEIKKGTTLSALSDSLAAKGIIRKPSYFQLYMKINRLTPKLSAGVFFFRDTVSIEKVAHLLTSPDKSTIKISIPEGRNRWEIFKLLHNKMPWLNAKIWDDLSTDPQWLEEVGLKGRESVEGYLFPATYDFPAGADEASIQQIMIHQFHKVWITLDTNNSDKLKQYGSLGVLTMSSIVEEEAAVSNERKEIAGVFYNRLRDGIPLGADPTVRYIFKNKEGPILKSQLQSDSPYNTRRFKGLPPGPIANPGKASLDAALHPNNTAMLYFVAKDDGSHQHYFAKSYQEHLHYCDVAGQNRKKNGRSEAAEY